MTKRTISTRDALLELRTVVSADADKAAKIEGLVKELNETVAERSRCLEAALGTLEGYVALHSEMHGFNNVLEELAISAVRQARPVRDNFSSLEKARAAKAAKAAKAPKKGKKGSSGRSGYHQLTSANVALIKSIHEKFGDKAHAELDMSDSGFDLLALRRVGDNVTYKTADSLVKYMTGKRAAKKAAVVSKKGSGYPLALAESISLSPKEQDFVDVLTKRWPAFTTPQTLTRKGIIPKPNHVTAKVTQLRKKGVPIESATQARANDPGISSKARGYRLIG